MAIPNTKNNFISKLLGKTNDKNIMPAEIDYRNNYQQGLAYTPGYVGPGAPTAAQVTPPTAGAVDQAQAQPSPQATGSRYNLMQMLMPEPTRDTAGEETIRRRAKANAFGRGLSSLAGLAGMHMGGDAPAIEDQQTPWNMNQLQMMDTDYRRRLQDWTDKGFQVEAANNAILNREVDQTIDSENQMQQIDARAQYAAQLADQKAQQALELLQTKTQAEQIKEMQKLGINPMSENAYGEYLEKNRQKFNTDLNYTKARTNWNNRVGSTANSRYSGGQQQFDIPTLTQGRNARIAQLEAQKAQALEGKNPLQQVEIAKQYDEMLKEARNYKPGANPLIDAEMMQVGIQATEGKDSNGDFIEGGPAAQSGPVSQFDQNRGFTNVPVSEDPIVKQRLSQGFQKAFEGTLTEDDYMQIIHDLIASGDAQDEEEAHFYLERFIEENQNQ